MNFVKIVTLSKKIILLSILSKTLRKIKFKIKCLMQQGRAVISECSYTKPTSPY